MTQQHNNTMDEARYREMRERMAAVKSLYTSRHYSQCAKLGELLLSEMHDQVSIAITHTKQTILTPSRHTRSTWRT
jgi:hypothetical protein